MAKRVSSHSSTKWTAKLQQKIQIHKYFDKKINLLAYLDGFWQNSCCLHNSANVISGESPLGWRSPKLLFLDFYSLFLRISRELYSPLFCGCLPSVMFPVWLISGPFRPLSRHLMPVSMSLPPRVLSSSISGGLYPPLLVRSLDYA